MTDVLEGIPLFYGCSQASLELLRACKVRNYTEGDELCVEGQAADDALVILSGEVQISMSGTLLTTRRTNDVIGEQAILEDCPRTASVSALGAVRALRIPSETFLQLLDDVRFTRNLAKALSIKLDDATAERALRYRREQLLFHEFSAHLSQEITDELLNEGRSYGEPRLIEAALMFSDIRSYTANSAQRDPLEVAAELSSYLEWVVDVIHSHDGMVDKFIGDAVLAVWGFTSNGGDLVHSAMHCAEQLVLSASKRTLGGEPIRVGAGLNYGKVFVGNIGGGAKRQFTVIGEPVNLAARYEAESKQLAPIVFGPDFARRLPASYSKIITEHQDREIRGAKAHTIYSYNPFPGGTSGE